MAKLDDDFLRLSLMRREYAAWRILSDALIASGAVTAADASSPCTDDATPGQHIYNLIREWGDALVSLRNGKGETTP